MKYLNYKIEDLLSNEGFDTAREISSQPEVWKSTYLKMLGEKDQVLQFLEKVWENECPIVLLTGAGSSAFIG